MNKVFIIPIVLSVLFLCVLSSVSAQAIQSELNQLAFEINQIEENIQSCQSDIDDIQAEIDNLIKNTPSPITGTETEKRIRQLQKDRALYRCWKKITEKKLKRLKEIREELNGGYNPSIKAKPNRNDAPDPAKLKKKVAEVERKAENLKRAGQHMEDTIDNALEKK